MPRIWPLKSGDSSMLLANEIVDAIGRVQQVTGDLRRDRCGRSGTRTAPAGRRRARPWKREKSMLLAVEPRRRAGLQPAPLEAERLQRLREIARRRLAGAAGRPLLRPDVDQPVEERAGRDDQRAAAEALAVFELEPADAPVLATECGPALPKIHSMFGSASSAARTHAL